MYKVICVNSPYPLDAIKGLEKKVNELKEKGWTVQGGVSISHDTKRREYYFIACQAMVKDA